MKKIPANLRALGQAQLSQEVDDAIEAYEGAAKLSEDGKIYERLSYLYLEDDQYGRCVDSASGALDKGGLRKAQSVVHRERYVSVQPRQVDRSERFFLCNVAVWRVAKMTRQISECGQWITFIDRESARLKQLAAASG